MKGPFGEKLVFKKTFSLENFKSKSTIFFIDDKLKDKLKNKIDSTHHHKLFLKGGESLKTLDQYQKNLNFLMDSKAHKKTHIVAIGGGSVLDSVGFLASTYMRGVDLTLVPTTWLSCIDASVGGKTALNLNKKKNQVGTVYPPKSILFFEELVSKESMKDAQGEILKTLSLNHNAKWVKEYIKKGRVDFKALKDFVAYKSKIVKSDPFEKKNIRTVLNLGHTLGHVVELKKNLSHGESVLIGLKFSLIWSHKKKKIDDKNFEKLLKLLPQKSLKSLGVKEKDLRDYLYFDKKRVDEKINFIFLNNKGPEVLKVSFDSLINEFKRQIND